MYPAGEAESTGGSPPEHPPGDSPETPLRARIERYGIAKARGQAMAKAISEDARWRSESVRLGDCGTWLEFRQYYTVGETRLTRACFCKQHLICPLCAIRRAARTVERYVERFNQVTQEAAGGSLQGFLVTLTVKNGPDLVERHAHLRGGWRTMCNQRRNHLANPLRNPRNEACKAEGAVWSYEVTNRGNGWHPHLHAIWLCREAPDAATLSHEWESITGDSFIVDVRPIDQVQPATGFVEVFKYAMKFSELTIDQNIEAWQALKGRRLIGSFGCFRGLGEAEVLTDDPLEGLPFIDLLYRYLPGSGYSLTRAVCVTQDGEISEVAAKGSLANPAPLAD